MSSKQLESILGRVTTATPKAQSTAPQPVKEAAAAAAVKSEVITLAPASPKVARKADKAPKPAQPERSIQAYVPVSVARALNVRAAQEDVTIRTLILQGLKSIGIEVSDDDLRDRRK